MSTIRCKDCAHCNPITSSFKTCTVGRFPQSLGAWRHCSLYVDAALVVSSDGNVVVEPSKLRLFDGGAIVEVPRPMFSARPVDVRYH